MSAAMPNAYGIVSPTKPEVHRRRMDRHVEVLQQRVEAARRRPAFAVRKVVERVVVHDHQEQEEHLDHGDDRDDVGNQLAVPLAVDVDGDAAEERQQRTPRT